MLMTPPTRTCLPAIGVQSSMQLTKKNPQNQCEEFFFFLELFKSDEISQNPLSEGLISLWSVLLMWLFLPFVCADFMIIEFRNRIISKLVGTFIINTNNNILQWVYFLTELHENISFCSPIVSSNWQGVSVFTQSVGAKV